MKRVPEVELMEDAASVVAYAAASFDEPHSRFVSLLGEMLPELAERGLAADLGCGPADVTIRFARAWPGWSIDAVDGSGPMLAAAEVAVSRCGLAGRITLRRVRLPSPPPCGRGYDLVFSNSLLHHLADPADLWHTLGSWARPGAYVFVMDLLRPDSEARARALVCEYASSEPEVLQQDFYNSLLAAYTPEEVRGQLDGAGLGEMAVTSVSDRHWIAWGRMPAVP